MTATRAPRGVAWRAAALAALVVVTLTAAVAAAQAPTHAPADDGPAVAAGAHVDEYVALGDSYTAGPLVPQSVPAFGCFRSTGNYPALLAAALRVDTFVDVSCSGADTTHLRSPQPTGFVGVPPQLAALSPSTDLVTLGIGGNDFDLFGRLVTVCPRARGLDPDGDPCREHFRAAGRGPGHGGADALLRAVRRTRDRLDRAVGDVRRRAPDAQVIVVGYPRIVPEHGTCPGVLPFADGDYRYAARVGRRLNAALRHAARSHGAEFVDTYRASRGHDACAGDRAWVNGSRTDPARAEKYHPFGSYMRAVARRVAARVTG